MKYLIPIVPFLLMTPFFAGADEVTEAIEEGRQDITDEQLREFAERREQYKDNPEAMKFIDAVQEELGISEDDIARARGELEDEDKPQQDQAQVEPERPAVEANPQLADQAYHSGDYETAHEHYKALADDGDPYANLIMGLMYQQGQGVDADGSRAHAYYERAAEHGDARGQELIRNLEGGMSDEELEEAQQYYHELAEGKEEQEAQ